MMRSCGSGRRLKCLVAGWRDAAGMLWEPSRLMAIKFSSERIDQDMMLKKVSYKQSIKEGTTAELEFCDPRALGGKEAKGKSDKAYAAPETD